MFSVCCSLFNAEKMEYSWRESLANFLEFGDELVVSINKSEDNTEELVREWAAQRGQEGVQTPVKIVLTDFADSDPEFYGKTQNSAVQNCTQQFIILVDIDEKLIVSQRKQWERLALEYIQKDKCDCILIPSVNLWGDELHAKDINQKWYLQRQGVRRGVVNFGRNKDGTINIEKSDGGEPIVDKEGTLARALMVVPVQLSPYEKIKLIRENNLPYVLHYGYVSFDKRIKRTELFWKKMWQTASGKDEVDVPTDKTVLENTPTFEHGLKTKDESEEIKLIK